MADEASDPDMKEAVNALGNALEAALLGASASEVQAVIDAIGDLVDIRIAMFAELAANRAEAHARPHSEARS